MILFTYEGFLKLIWGYNNPSAVFGECKCKQQFVVKKWQKGKTFCQSHLADHESCAKVFLEGFTPKEDYL